MRVASPATPSWKIRGGEPPLSKTGSMTTTSTLGHLPRDLPKTDASERRGRARSTNGSDAINENTLMSEPPTAVPSPLAISPMATAITLSRINISVPDWDS